MGAETMTLYASPGQQRVALAVEIGAQTVTVAAGDARLDGVTYTLSAPQVYPLTVRAQMTCVGGYLVQHRQSGDVRVVFNERVVGSVDTVGLTDEYKELFMLFTGIIPPGGTDLTAASFTLYRMEEAPSAERRLTSGN